MNRARQGATYLLAASLFSLAGALVYFALEISRVSRQIPDILTQVVSSGDTLLNYFDQP